VYRGSRVSDKGGKGCCGRIKQQVCGREQRTGESGGKKKKKKKTLGKRGLVFEERRQQVAEKGCFNEVAQKADEKKRKGGGAQKAPGGEGGKQTIADRLGKTRHRGRNTISVHSSEGNLVVWRRGKREV